MADTVTSSYEAVIPLKNGDTGDTRTLRLKNPSRSKSLSDVQEVINTLNTCKLLLDNNSGPDNADAWNISSNPYMEEKITRTLDIS